MKALVLAGGFPQIALIEKLKKMDYFVILADWNEHPVAEAYADKFYQASTLDIDGIEKIAIAEHVDLVITVCTDQALNTVAIVSEKLGLPCYINAITGTNVTNKRYMKSVFAEYDIPTAAFNVYNENDDISTFLKFPLIVKPVDCNSSKGVTKVFDESQMREAVISARRMSRTHDAIVEEFVEGPEFTIDVIVREKKAYVLCISEIQKIKENEKFVICRTILPSGKIDASKSKQMNAIAQKIVNAFDLKNCPLLIQAIEHKGEMKVVEFSARTGGGEKYKSIQWYTGVDIIQETINLTLGINSNVSVVYNHLFMMNEFIYCKEGIVDSYLGFEEALKAELITDYELYRKKGEHIGCATSSGDRAASMTLVAHSYLELSDKYKQVMSKLKILDSAGCDLMRHDIRLED